MHGPFGTRAAHCRPSPFEPLLPPRVVSKTTVVDPGSSADSATVASYITYEQLPELVGGGCKEWPPPDATLTKRW